MKLLGRPVDRTVENLDVSIPEHAEFMFDLAMACKEDMFDDYDTDIIQIIDDYKRALDRGIAKMFLCRVEGEKAGIVWVDLDTKGIGYLHAGLLPEFRTGFTALYFFRRFIEYCFETLNLRSLEMGIPTRNRKAEAIVRRIGFKKYGIKPAATTVNGQPIPLVLLAFTRDQYKGRKNGIKSEFQQKRKRKWGSASTDTTAAERVV